MHIPFSDIGLPNHDLDSDEANYDIDPFDFSDVNPKHDESCEDFPTDDSNVRDSITIYLQRIANALERIASTLEHNVIDDGK